MIIDYSKKFVKEFEKLPTKLQRKFQERILLFIKNPNHPLLRNHPLVGELMGLRSINVTGDIRALYQDSGENRVIFIAIGSHSQLYRS